MPFLFQYLIKFSLSLAVLYMFYYVVLRPLTFYQWNRFYLVCYSLLSFFIPFINITEWFNEKNISSSYLLSSVPAVDKLTSKSFNISSSRASILSYILSWNFVGMLFLAGASIMLVRIACQYISLKNMKRKAVLLKTGNFEFYDVNGPIAPFSFANSIFINSRLHSEEEFHKILEHEFVHVKQKHTIDIIVAEFICVFNWFNPFAWLIRKSIRQNLEFIADNNVLNGGIDPRQYQYLLLKVMGLPQYSITNNFSFSSLKKRIAMMNKMKTAKVHLVKFMFILPLLAVMLLAFRDRINAKNNDKVTEKVIDKRFTDFAQQRKSADTFLTAIQKSTTPFVKAGDKLYVVSGSSLSNLAATGRVEFFYMMLDSKDPVIYLNGKLTTIENINASVSRGEIKEISSPDEREAVKKYGGWKKQVIEIKTYSGFGSDTIPTAINDTHVTLVGVPLISYVSSSNVTKIKAVKSVPPTSMVRDTIPNVKLEKVNVTNIPAKSGNEKIEFNRKVVASKNGEVDDVKQITNVKIIDTTPVKIRLHNLTPGTEPLYIIDGETLPKGENLNKINPNSIESINVLKGPEALALYGPAAENGVLQITTKDSKKAPVTIKLKPKTVPGNFANFNGLLIVDGEEVGNEKLSTMDPDNIESISVLKSASATAIYNEKGKNGVIIVTTKKKPRQ